jgi:hypothetical protein
MADRQAFEPVVFLVSELPSGVPIARELKGSVEGHGGQETLKNVFNCACFTARDYTCVEEIMKQFCLGIVVALGLTLPAFGQGVDPLIGTWKMSVEKSTVIGVPPVKSETLVVTRDGKDFIDTAEGVDAQGQSFTIVFRHIYDGMPHPTTGNPDYDSTTYTRVGNTINGIRFKQGKPVEVAQIVIVPGKTWTTAAEGITAKGQPYHWLLVFDRQ